MGYNGGMSADADKARAAARVETVKAFIDWAEKRGGRSLLYRGLADANWEVESAAYRRIKKPSGAKLIPQEIPGVFKNYISQLLEKSSMRDFRTHEGNELSDLKLLARLQHYGAATCLIDFTQNPLVALWFACQEQPKKDGKVIVMDTGADVTIPNLSKVAQRESAFHKVGPEQLALKEGEIVKLLGGENLWIWEPTPRESRVIAQQSIFVFGPAMIEEHAMLEEHYGEVRIPESAKEKILHALDKKFGINEASLFGDFAGFALANAHDKSYEEHSADDYFEFAESFFQREDAKKAIRYCDKAIAKNKRHVGAHYLRGLCNRRLGEMQESVKDFSQALEADPAHMPSLWERAWMYLTALNRAEDALDDYNTIIEIASNNKHKYYDRLAHAYKRRGYAYMNLKGYQNAEDDFTKIIELFSSSGRKIRPWLFVSAYQDRGRVRAVRGNHQGAIEDFTFAIQRHPGPILFRDRAKSYRALGDESAAKADESKAESIIESVRRHHGRSRGA